MSGARVGPLPLAAAFGLGIALAPVAGLPAWTGWILAVALALAARRHVGFLVAATVVAGLAIGAPGTQELGPGVVADDRHADRIVGVIAGPIVGTAHGTGAALRTDAADVWVWSDSALVPGERVAVTGRVRTSATGFELTAISIEPLGDAATLRDRAWRWAAVTQARWSSEIDDAGGEPAARAALRGIVVGDRRAIPAELDDRWRAVGIYHVLSVSGLHLAVIAGLVFAALRRLIAGSPWGGRVRPARWAAPPALVIAIAYTLVTGAQLATLRALVVITLVLVAATLDRPIRLVDALGAAALVLLAWRPQDLLDPSFQLSFTAALTLALRPASARRGVRAWILRGLATSAWVTITTAPITAFHFHQVTPGGIVGNLVLTPFVELLALPLALAGIALGLAPLVRAATAIVAEVDRVAELLARVMPVGMIAVAGAITLAVLVALSLVLASRAHRTRRDALGWAALCIAWALARTPPPPGALRVTFLDVGQGDAALVELPDGAVWLIDAGGHPNARSLAAASAPAEAIGRALTAAGHDRIDLAVLSHPHPDHYLGLAAITVPIGELWSAAEPAQPAAYRGGNLPSFAAIASVLAARGTRLVHPPLGLARSQAGVELVVWAPRYQAIADGPVIGAADPVRSVNDNSLVIAIHYRGRVLLFTGDLEAEGEDLLVGAGAIAADVVKVPHHGSPTSSSRGLVEATRPSIAVISCGRGNSFGFPASEVLARWQAAGARIARTDTDGAITVVVDAAGRLFVVE